MDRRIAKANALTDNKHVLQWIEEVVHITEPETVVWITGEEEQLDTLRKEACDLGILEMLNQDKMPGCYLHRSDINDVARVEDRTFICTKEEHDAGPTNNWMEPEAMYAKMKNLYKGTMKGKEMYVVPFTMGTPGSTFAKYGIEITDSIYVVLSMAIMTRIGKSALVALGDSSEFTKGWHAKANLNPEDRYIVHFPEDNCIMSINSGYGGNVLLGKKCLALRIASYQAKEEGWLAEHMLILGIENPRGQVRYVAAAFPSACGKTNLAMLIPPALYQKAGWKIFCVGDDIAWLRVGEDGRLWATNPENGFFGVAPGTGKKSNPNALQTVSKNSIFTNVVQNMDDNTVWWEGLDKNPPSNALDWKGEKWDSSTGKPGAHPNSRFTAPAENCPVLSSEFGSDKGVPISAIIFGGRRAKTAPLVYQSRDWEHGVFVGSIMTSETTAAKVGEVGVVRRDPMAMLPFCGYNMGDYWQHWLDMAKNIEHKPKIFNVNWFRTDEDGNYIWPGFGENLRVLEWILERCHDGFDAIKTPIGKVPFPEDIDINKCDISQEQLEEILSVDKDLWIEEMKSAREFYKSFGDSLPEKLWNELEKTEDRLGMNTGGAKEERWKGI